MYIYQNFIHKFSWMNEWTNETLPPYMLVLLSLCLLECYYSNFVSYMLYNKAESEMIKDSILGSKEAAL